MSSEKDSFTTPLKARDLKGIWMNPDRVNALKAGGVGIRTAFRIAILALVILAFLGAMSASYANVTSNERARAEASIRSEVNYLCLQLESLDERTEAPEGTAEESEIAVGGREENRLLGNLLEGYTLAETGFVAILADRTVVSTNSERLPVGADVRQLLGESINSAIDESLESGAVQSIPYEGTLSDLTSPGNKEALLLAGQQGEYTVMIIEPSSLVFKNRVEVMGRQIIVTLLILALVFLIVDRLLVIMVARRIDKTNAALKRITAGDLDVRVEDVGTHEFKSLAYGINNTVDALNGLIAEVEARMDEELATAKTIQEATLPRTFPPFPHIPKFDIYASMDAARQVGGDFYDFFLVGENCTAESGKLGFVVADVSGKGIPAALFMMKAKTLIRNYVESGMELGEAVTEANRQICEGNETDMFVTAWIGVLDYGTGHIDFVNAGHNPPLFHHENAWRWVRERSGTMLGLLERPYKAHAIECDVGDTLLLYTDGVTEAFDVDEELYGETRLLNLVEKKGQLHPHDLLKAVEDDVAAYAQGAEQSDDITIMALAVGVPPEMTDSIEVPATIDQLDHVNEFLHDELDRRLCPKRVQNQLDISVEELFVNVCRYAYPDKTSSPNPTVRIRKTYSANPSSLTVDIIDSGIAFNPLEKPDAIAPKNIEDAPIGGLGILMAKKSVDEIRYERAGNRNIVTIVKRW